MFITFESMVNSLEKFIDFNVYTAEEYRLMQIPSVDYCWRQYQTEVFSLPSYIQFVNSGFWIRNKVIVPKVFELIEAVKGSRGQTEWASIRLYQRAVIVLPDYKTPVLDTSSLYEEEL
jgi:hypothetical protein